jgi:hypothetical protein
MVSPGYIPGPLVIPLTWQVRLAWILPNGRIATNVLHAIVPSGGDPDTDTCNALFDDIAAATETTAYFAFLAGTTALQFLDIRDLRVANMALVQSSSGAVPGTGTLHALPEEVALVVTLRSALAGRAHRGRVYLTGYDASAIDTAGHAVAGLTAGATDWMNMVRSTFLGHGISLGIGHRGHAEYVNAKGATIAAEEPGTDLVTSCIVQDNVFDSQRRRK